jgi:hypothetical protein
MAVQGTDRESQQVPPFAVYNLRAAILADGVRVLAHQYRALNSNLDGADFLPSDLITRLCEIIMRPTNGLMHRHRSDSARYLSVRARPA